MARPDEKAKPEDARLPETSVSAPMPRKTPIWTDQVDEVLIFSDLKPEKSKPQDCDDTNGK